MIAMINVVCYRPEPLSKWIEDVVRLPADCFAPLSGGKTVIGSTLAHQPSRTLT